MSPRVTEEHKKQRKQEIIAAAIKIFERKGIEQATMKDIVEESGMSRGGVYLYFSSPVEIFEELLLQMDQQNAKEMAEFIKGTTSMWEAIEYFLDQFAESQAKVKNNSLLPVIYEYVLSGWREKDRLEYLNKRYIEKTSYFTELFEKGVASGEFQPSVSPAVLSKTLGSFIDGLNIGTILSGGEIVESKPQIEAMKQFLRQALGI